MKISPKDALHILGLTTSATLEDIKQAYRKACSKYHPDRNPAGLQMMQLVNVAYDMLADYVPTGEADTVGADNYGQAINDALNAIIGLGLEIEICGSWLWVSGDTRPHKDTLKQAGYRWAPKKAMWHFRPPEYKSFNRGKWSMEQIRGVHGSQVIKQKRYTAIAE